MKVYILVIICYNMKNKPKQGVYSREYKNSKVYLKGVIPNIPRGKTKKKI